MLACMHACIGDTLIEIYGWFCNWVRVKGVSSEYIFWHQSANVHIQDADVAVLSFSKKKNWLIEWYSENKCQLINKT